MVINTNLAAANGQRLLSDSTNRLNKSLSRLASGSKLTNPQDDSAGMAVVTKFDAAINRNKAVQANVANAISFSQTQDGFLQKVSKSLDRMGEILTLARNNTLTLGWPNKDKAKYQREFREIESYISDIGTRDFNGVSLFDGTGLDVTKDSEGNTWSLNSVSLNDTGGDINDVFSITWEDNIGVGIWWNPGQASLNKVKTAIENVAASRAKVGANLRRLQYTDDHLATLNENLSSTISRIKDVDVASESTRFARYKILNQAGTVMLAQANLLPQNPWPSAYITPKAV